ncbi:MAG: DNA translocase FtsK [Candidatus Pacebacteria bacterium]|nr:DNA translocase FtsK [Candidatus Paceibacterota bacterium]
MKKNKKNKKLQNSRKNSVRAAVSSRTEKRERKKILLVPEETKKWILGIVIFIVAAIITLSFFDSAGVAGKAIMETLTFLIGRVVFIFPLILALGGFIFFNTKYEKYLGPVILGILLLTVGAVGFLECLNPGARDGGMIGYASSWPFLKLFGVLVTKIIFAGIIVVGGLIFWYLMKPSVKKLIKEELEEMPVIEENTSLIKKIFAPKFKIKEVGDTITIRDNNSPREEQVVSSNSKDMPQLVKPIVGEYKAPPLDLLESEKGKPSAGDTIMNSMIIKKTLDNFGLSVEMSEINIGPAVTQYTLKPAEGIKLNKITGLSNNLSLALAAHPIRLEAPIPGKSLVGIEIPNKERCKVRLKDLLSNPNFQKTSSSLTLALGKDVSGQVCFTDLARMPHLLVAGATGTGKTVFLNTLILSLLYQNSPASLRLILIDPKRVEFSAYKEIPHLLCPVIFNAQKSVNALKWIISEMERRFDVLSQNGSRDLSSYNNKVAKSEESPLPYIVLIVDELADLMASKGREMEAGIVRLAQMARAVGIHLVLATQRPSVEVVTGLIKANITSRVAFQVASQVDSRTILDTAGADKLLGQGDLLFISNENPKPKRIQGAFISEKEVKKVVEYIDAENAHLKVEESEQANIENEVPQEGDMEQGLQKSLEGAGAALDNEEDSLYEEAKKTVIESKKASASLLQRRLRVGYARAARLLDILEEKGVVGPGEGAKPREVYLGQESIPGEVSEDGWKKV